MVLGLPVGAGDGLGLGARDGVGECAGLFVGEGLRGVGDGLRDGDGRWLADGGCDALGDALFEAARLGACDADGDADGDIDARGDRDGRGRSEGE